MALLKSRFSWRCIVLRVVLGTDPEAPLVYEQDIGCPTGAHTLPKFSMHLLDTCCDTSRGRDLLKHPDGETKESTDKRKLTTHIPFAFIQCIHFP